MGQLISLLMIANGFSDTCHSLSLSRSFSLYCGNQWLPGNARFSANAAK